MFRQLAAFIVCLFCGCAAAFAPKDAKPIDIAQVTVGMPRTQVEELLGPPIHDIRPNMGTGAMRECDYVYTEREELKKDPSYYQVMANYMVGFKELRVRVYYDAQNRVLRVLSHQELSALRNRERR